MRPMLAARGTHVPDGPGWAHEIKWDGMRALVGVDASGITLSSRRGNDVSVSFPELKEVLRLLDDHHDHHDLLLDGEIVAFDGGVPRFGALQERIHVTRAGQAAQLARSNPVTLLVFDLLRLDGVDLTREPLAVRRALLDDLGIDLPHCQVPAQHDDGAELFDITREQGLEGIVSKRLDSRYEPGVRSGAWLKFPHRLAEPWVVGGWRFQTESRVSLGALLVGEPSDVGLLYRGRVGSGLNGRLAAALRDVLAPLAISASPFVDEVPRLDAAGAHWVEPLLVVDVDALGLTSEGRLRQPALKGVRTDLTPADL